MQSQYGNTQVTDEPARQVWAETQLNLKQNLSEKAQPNGYASLDGSGQVPLSQIPSSLIGNVSFQGVWNANTNTPVLASGVGTKGFYYIVSVAGTTNLDGISDWQVGDFAIYSGTAWQKIDNTDAVVSVNGMTGAVVLTTTNISEGTNLYFTTARVLATVLAGLSLASGTNVDATDTILVAIGKLQNQAIRKSENIYSSTTDQLINLTVVSAAFTNFFSLTTSANDSLITDGRTLRVKGVMIFNKTAIGNTTYEVECNIAGTSIVTGAFSTGAPVISNQTWDVELVLNFRSGNQAQAKFNFTRGNTTGQLANFTIRPAGLITFNKTLANNITFGARIVSTAVPTNITRQQATAVIE